MLRILLYFSNLIFCMNILPDLATNQSMHLFILAWKAVANLPSNCHLIFGANCEDRQSETVRNYFQVIMGITGLIPFLKKASSLRTKLWYEKLFFELEISFTIWQFREFENTSVHSIINILHCSNIISKWANIRFST